MKKLLLLTTGGTIASVETENGLAPAATPQELLSYIPQADTFCEVDVRQLFNIDSTNIQPEHWTRIALEIETSFTDYDGFVITHGTDTMAYTAAALSYLVQNAPKPIVLTGSQKPMSAPVTDAKKNLLDSLRFAVQNDVHGVYVVFDGKQSWAPGREKCALKATVHLKASTILLLPSSTAARYSAMSAVRKQTQRYAFITPLSPVCFL